MGTSEDLAEKVVVTTKRDGREILELDPGFSKNRLYSSYGWKNGWKVQYNKATRNYKLVERDDDGWLGHYKHGTTIKKNLTTTDITQGRSFRTTPSMNIIISNMRMVIKKNLQSRR